MADTIDSLRVLRTQNLYGEQLSDAEAARVLQHLSEVAILGSGLQIGRIAQVGPVYIGERSIIGDDVTIHGGSYIGSKVRIGNGTRIEADVIILDGANIGERSIIRSGVVIWGNVDLPPETSIGDYERILSTDAIATLGRLGASKRMITVHGSDAGQPKYTTGGDGCQHSVDWSTFSYRIRHHVQTSPESAAHYQTHLEALRLVGITVQDYHNQAAATISDLDQRINEARALVQAIE